MSFQITLPPDTLAFNRVRSRPTARVSSRNYKGARDRLGLLERVARMYDLSVHYPAIHLFSLYRARGFSAGMFPHAGRFGASTVTLPLFTQMTEEDVARVCRAINEVCAQHARHAKGEG